MEHPFDLNKSHSIVLNLYKELQKICESHKLRYYAISGTTIGAVLWNGIIPWDDDIDIALPAEDYAKLIEILKHDVLPKHIGFIEYIWFGIKIYDNRTMFTNACYLDDPRKYIGISIDVVPLINIPNNKLEQESFIKRLKALHEDGALFEKYGILKNRKTEDELKCEREHLLYDYKFGETEYVMDFSDCRYVLKAQGFEKPEKMKFEDCYIWVSSNYHDDLTIQYGHYQKNPPKDKRESIHQKLSLINLNKSCLEYAKNFDESKDEVKRIIKAQHNYEGFCEDGIYYRDRLLAETDRKYKELFEENERLKAEAIELKKALSEKNTNLKTKISRFRSKIIKQ